MPAMMNIAAVAGVTLADDATFHIHEGMSFDFADRTKRCGCICQILTSSALAVNHRMLPPCPESRVRGRAWVRSTLDSGNTFRYQILDRCSVEHGSGICDAVF